MAGRSLNLQRQGAVPELGIVLLACPDRVPGRRPLSQGEVEAQAALRSPIRTAGTGSWIRSAIRTPTSPTMTPAAMSIA